MLVAGSAPAVAMPQPGANGSISARKTGVEQIDRAKSGRPARTAEIPQVTSVQRKGLPDAAPIGGRDRCDPASRRPVLQTSICRPDLHVSAPAESSLHDKGRVSSLVQTLADETGRADQNIDDMAGAIAILGFLAGIDPPPRK